MKQVKLIVALGALPMVFAGCDIFKADTLEAPSLQLTGHVVHNGEPVPVGTPGGSQLRVWQTSWDEGDPDRQPEAMGIAVNMDGSFSALVYRGDYDIQLIDNQGPWVNDTTRIPLVINGDTEVDIEVDPYYTIEDADIVYNPPAAGADNAGSITATFRVGGPHVTSPPPVELVGLYVSTTTFVDRTRRETSLMVQTDPPPPPGQSGNNPHERSRAQVATQLANNEPISITLILPNSIRLTRSPDPRTTLYARVGVKAVGVGDLAYSEVEPVNIAP